MAGEGSGQIPLGIHGILRDTGKKRGVRIQLECILVEDGFAMMVI